MTTEPDASSTDAPDQSLIVQRWGAPTRGGKRAYRLPDSAEGQLRLAHRLGNDLVALSKGLDTTIQEIDSSYPQVAAAEGRLRLAEEAAAVAAAEHAKAKSEQRTRSPKGTTAQALREARAAAREARAAVREAKASIKLDARDRKVEARRQHGEAVKALRQQYAAEGLYWGTSNDVIAKSGTADQRVIQARKAGRHAERRFKRWDGSGSLTVQLQRQATEPPRTVDRLTAEKSVPGKSWAGQLQVPDRYGRRRAGHSTVKFGLGSQLPMVEVPVVAHRALPDGADVTGARLVREAIAGQRHISIHVTAKIPAPTPKAEGATIALHLGWRRDADSGAVRVAAWRSDTDLVVPGHLRDIVTQDAPNAGQVLLPAALRRQMGSADRVRSERDKRLNEIQAWLAEWLATNPQPVVEGVDPLTPARVKAWRSAGRFAALSHRWRETPPVGDGATWVAGELAAWRKWDKGKWESESHGRKKAIGRRRDAYRRTAAWMAREARTLVVEDTDLSAVIRLPKTGEVLPGKVEDAASSVRFDAAPGELRAAAVGAGRREGVGIIEVDHRGSTVIHHACGYENPADERWATSALVRCDGCGRTFDQDANSTAGMLARALLLDN